LLALAKLSTVERYDSRINILGKKPVPVNV
jgi:hypothetical protein